MTDKPIVRYDVDERVVIKKGGQALVFPLNHPNPTGYVSNTKLVKTSIVISHDKTTGVFETLNTIYIPNK